MADPSFERTSREKRREVRSIQTLAPTTMLIFNSNSGDPMLLDSLEGLHVIYEEFKAFLSSASEVASFSAVTSGNPDPYSELLGGLRVRKIIGNGGLAYSNDRWLELSGSQLELTKFAEALLVESDGAHHHWYSSPVSLIIEADNWRSTSES